MASASPESTPRRAASSRIASLRLNMVAAASSSGLGATQGRSVAYAAHVSAPRAEAAASLDAVLESGLVSGTLPPFPKPACDRTLAHDAALPRTRQPYAGIVDLCENQSVS